MTRFSTTGYLLFQFIAMMGMARSFEPTSPPTITVGELKNLIESSPHLLLLEATTSSTPILNASEFKAENLYGKFEELGKLWANADYPKQHIPGAAEFNIEVATYPGEFQKQSLYEYEVFQKYARLVGINQDSEIVVYSRGANSGMLLAARAWWLLKVYGVEKVRVLEGGLDMWKISGGAVTNAASTVKPGNFVTQDRSKQLDITFDELFGNGTSVKHNLFDARPAAQFNGTEPLAFPPNGAPGFHLEGATNIPVSTLFDNGVMKSGKELNDVLDAAGVSTDQENITYCNSGVYASLLALSFAKAGRPYRVFNGSLIEVSRRQPSLISGK